MSLKAEEDSYVVEISDDEVVPDTQSCFSEDSLSEIKIDKWSSTSTDFDKEKHQKSKDIFSQNQQTSWCCFGKKMPRGEVVFISQTFLIFIVVMVSLYNISTQGANLTLWTALLSSSLGILLPNPSLKREHFCVFKKYNIKNNEAR